MTFISISFIAFIAAVILVYFAVPSRYQWIVLLTASYVFYWINSGVLLLVMFGSTAATFLTARIIENISSNGKKYISERAGELTKEEKKALKEKTKKRTRLALFLGIVVVLGMLLFLKYFNFFGSNVSKLLSLAGIQAEVPVLNILLPLGISYYTLQAIGYMVDIYRGKYEADKNLCRFMLFISFFPQVIQGPIPRYNQLAPQLYEGHSFQYERFCYGAQLILWGWMKKLIIADRLAIPVNQIFDHSSGYHGIAVFFGAALYGLQVYTDFSGGMDIARGVSQILGIDLELNFRQPYFSTSIEDFWRRWHITLGAWMKDYVFYPLSLSKAFTKLSRKSRKVFGQFIGKRLPAFLAMFVVYFLVGFWHGPSWKYVAYGIWNGCFIMAGILLDETYGKLRKVFRIQSETVTWHAFQMTRTFILISVGRIFSRAAALSTALHMFRALCTEWYDLSFFLDGSLFDLGLNNANWILLAVSIIVLFLVDFLHEKDIRIRESIAKQSVIFRWGIYFTAVLLIFIFGIYGPEYDAASFIYGMF